MRTPIIAGNWKMNKTAVSAVEFVNEIKATLDAISGIDKVVCPPFLAIPGVAAALAGTSIGVGAQNMHFEPNGAYTGEVAADMLVPFCQYVILGHSERREYFAETDEGVNRKIKVALAHGLTPIVCVGESLAQNEAGETVSFVSGQVQAAFAGFSEADAARILEKLRGAARVAALAADLRRGALTTFGVWLITAAPTNPLPVGSSSRMYCGHASRQQPQLMHSLSL